MNVVVLQLKELTTEKTSLQKWEKLLVNCKIFLRVYTEKDRKNIIQKYQT